MVNRMRLAVFLASAVFLSGCGGASVQTRQAVRFPDQTARVEDPAKARVTLLRLDDDAPGTFLVKDGPKRVGSTASRGYLCWEREPGEMVLRSYFDENVDTLRLSVEKGGTYYVKQRVVQHAFGHADTKLEPVGEDEGRKLLKSAKAPIANTKLARPVKGKGSPGLDLTRYEVVTVAPFAAGDIHSSDPEIGPAFADEIHDVLLNSFGPLFREVRFGAPTGAADELVVTGTIRNYDPGNRAARLFLAGAGAAKFNADVVLRDGSTQNVLLSATLDKLWAWGGMAGVSTGIDDMISQSAVAVASTVAQGKGWKPKD